jgi:hypothetical protein
MVYAPSDFGAYGGQLFMASRPPMAETDTNRGLVSMREPLTHAPASAGEVYRLDDRGLFSLVATGFRKPHGVHFFQNRLWVSDVNGDFIAGRRELPDGFVIEITPA